MADYIPFINSREAAKLAAKFYADADFARIPLERATNFVPTLKSTKAWIDACVEGLDDLPSRQPRADRPNSWHELMMTIPAAKQIGDPTFWGKPDPKLVEQFVKNLLERCAQ